MKYFVISDVHGEYHRMIRALEAAGFDKDKHTLITLGDMFDRGPGSRDIYLYLKSLPNVKHVYGNHDKMFYTFLTDPFHKDNYFNIEHNGLGATINSFVEPFRELIGMDNDLDTLASLILQTSPGIVQWLESMPLYLETDTHILVHAGLNPDLEDWRKSTFFDFCWDIEFMHKETAHIPKTIVFGHMWAYKLRKQITGDYNMDNSTFYYENKVAIDGKSNGAFGLVNVYTFEEE